jgi:hypothetical protein
MRYASGVAQTKKQVERGAALVRLEAEQVSDAVARLGAVLTGRAALDPSARERLDELSAATERLRVAFHDIPVGLTVAQAATRLDVSIPTVKKWIRERLLETVPDRSPIEVTQQSVVRVERILENVRLAYPAKQWTRALAAYLHDQDLQSQDWFVDGLAQVRRGAYVER